MYLNQPRDDLYSAWQFIISKNVILKRWFVNRTDKRTLDKRLGTDCRLKKTTNWFGKSELLKMRYVHTNLVRGLLQNSTYWTVQANLDSMQGRKCPHLISCIIQSYGSTQSILSSKEILLLKAFFRIIRSLSRALLSTYLMWFCILSLGLITAKKLLAGLSRAALNGQIHSLIFLAFSPSLSKLSWDPVSLL